jgi:hypothetical protein
VENYKASALELRLLYDEISGESNVKSTGSDYFFLLTPFRIDLGAEAILTYFFV